MILDCLRAPQLLIQESSGKPLQSSPLARFMDLLARSHVQLPRPSLMAVDDATRHAENPIPNPAIAKWPPNFSNIVATLRSVLYGDGDRQHV